jgi:hypothetical protein
MVEVAEAYWERRPDRFQEQMCSETAGLIAVAQRVAESNLGVGRFARGALVAALPDARLRAGADPLSAR